MRSEQAQQRTGGVARMPTYLTVSEVAKIVRRHPDTIRRWIADGVFGKVSKVKDGYLISEHAIKKILTPR